MMRFMAESATIFAVRQTFGDDAVLALADCLNDEERAELAQRHSHQLSSVLD